MFQLVLDGEGKPDLLAGLVLDEDWSALSIWVLGEVQVDERGWEGDEGVDRSNEVPAAGVDSILVYLLGNGVVHYAVLDRLDSADTGKQHDQQHQQAADTAADTT